MSTAGHRAAYIDWTRGLAVLLMIEAHTLDAWTRVSSRGSQAYAYAAILAGFAAPLFLWLAGLSVPLAAAARRRRGASRREAAESVCRRGLEIFILAFLFRLQAFVLSPGAHPVTLFRVDILNIMGPAICAAAVVWLLCESSTTLVITFSLLAATVSITTPLLRHATIVDALPTWVQWYIRPSGDNTTFTSFPWIGFVFAGGAVGAMLAAVRDRRREAQLLVSIGVAGLAIVVAGFYAASRPSLYADSSFWTTSPAFFAIRAGVLMAVLAATYVLERSIPALTRALSLLAQMGRSSLFVYWIHVELVYGYASWPLRRHLPLWGTGVAFLCFALLMTAAVVIRDRVLDARRRKTQIAFRYKAEAV